MISVIIPAFNAEKYIARSITSVLNQTYQDIEIIVVNDGSTDSTQAIVEDLCKSHKQITLINTENRGVSCARNTGIDNTNGEFLSFLDADDELLPDALQNMLDCLLVSGADICSSGCFQENRSMDLYSKQFILWDQVTGVKKALLDSGPTHACWAKLFRSCKLSSVRFPEGKRVHEDSFFIFCCLTSGMTMALLDCPTYIYYAVPGSVSRSGFSEKMFDMLDLAAEKERIIRKNYPELIDYAQNIVVKASMALLGNLCKSTDKKYRRSETACIRTILEKKKYFVPSSNHDKKWFYVITHRLYYLYKLFYQAKNVIAPRIFNKSVRT